MKNTKITEREREVLTYLAQGCTKAETANKCGVSYSRVCNILNTLRLKTGAKNTIMLMAIATRENIIECA